MWDLSYALRFMHVVGHVSRGAAFGKAAEAQRLRQRVSIVLFKLDFNPRDVVLEPSQPKSPPPVTDS